MGRTIVDIDVVDTEKRKIPTKHYVYVIYVTWSDGSTNVIYRRYSRFFDFQSKLTEMFPEEAGSMDPRSRIIPFLPGKKFFGRSHIREVAVKRMAPIAEYCKSIVKLPRKISQSKEVLDFFDLEPDDIDPPKEKKKTEIKANKISAPKALEHYIAVSEYQKQEKGEITLKVGMLVEVLEKTETGWWFVTVEDEQGWVPSTCLEREDGVKEDTTKRFKPGEEEQYLCTEEFIPHGEDELGLERGAVVDVVEKNLEGWWIVRYNGKEGYVPATFLMKSEAFSMKKQKVKRASVGGPEIVRNLHDISDLLKEDTKEEPEQEEKCFTLHELSKILKEDKRGSEETEKVYECIESQKSRSLKRGGLTRPPPRLSVKPKRGEQFPVSQRLQVVHAESFLKEYITIADFSDAVGDGISFKAGEVVKVLEKRDGGWWYIEIGNKEGWAPATYIEESSQGPVQPPSFDHKESRITREQSEDFFTSDSESDESEEDTAPRSSSGFGGLANALKAKLTKTTSKPLPSTPNRKEAESIEKNEKSIADNKPVPPAPPLKNLADNRPVPPAPPVKNLADNRPAPPAPPVKNLADNRPVPPTPPLKNLADNRPAPPAPPAKHLNEKADTSQDDVQSAFPVHLRHVEKETTKQRAKNKPDQTQKVPLRMGAPPPPPPSKGSDTKEPASPPKQKKPALPIHSKQFEKKAQLEDDGRRPRSSVDEELSGTKGIAGALKAKFGSDAVRPTSVSDTNKTSNTTDIKKPKFGEIGIKPHLGPTKPWTAKAEPQTQSEKSRIVGHEALKKPETLQKPGAMKKPDFNIRDSHVSVPKSTEKEVISVGKVSDLASVLKSKLEGRQNVGDSQSHSQDNEKASHAVGHPNSPQKPANILQPNIGTKPPRPQTPPSPRLHQKPGHPGGYRKSANTENRDSTTHLNEGNAAKLSALFDGKDNKDLDPTKYSARPLPPKPDESASAVADDRDSRKSIVTNIPGKPAPTLAVKPKINFGHKQEVGQSGGLNSDLGGDRPPGVAGLASALKAKLEIKPGNVGAGDNRPDINTKPAILNKPITRIKPKPGGKNILQSGSENGIVNNAGQTEEVYCAVADFPGENEGEISLTIGIHVKLLEKAEPWWYVTYGSKEGWAPASYFEQVKPGDSSGITQSNPASNQTYLGKERPAQYKQALFRTLSDFTAENDGELSFAGGMEVTVLEKPEGGWWYVQIGRQEGWVPEAFLEEVVS